MCSPIYSRARSSGFLFCHSGAAALRMLARSGWSLDGKHVALVQRCEHTRQQRPVGPYPAHLFTEDLDGAASLKGINLPRMILLGGRHAGIAVFQCM
jgi:hypothetical protein